ncbi:hypothetical protein [Streptomyces similanensis]|uniref:LamG domain-containing protein n=1 Tax=Streptomyces similanensis TaxID=1274988 RepID=A0ABP9KGE9_9ACTN
MTFPTTPLGLRGELKLGDTWQDITSDLYTRDPITHTRGRPYKSNAADPAVCSATLRNVDGRYTPKNAEGPWYGQLGRNTPFRITLPGTGRYLDMTGTAALATTPDAAALDITGDLDVRWEGEADWNASGAQMLIGKWSSAAGNRSYHLRLQDGAVYFQVSTNGTTGVGVAGTLPALPRRAALRGTLDADNGAGGCTLNVYSAPSLQGPWTLLYTFPTTALGPISVYNSNAPLTIAPSQADSTPARPPAKGKTYRAEVRNGIDGVLAAAPDFTAQAAGTTQFTDSAGRAWTVAAGAITDRIVRFEGEVPEWPAKWSTSARDAWTPITAAGILRRLSAGQRTLDSPLRRRIPSYKPLAYWPMEDGPNATQAASPTTGVRPLKMTATTWARDSSLAASKPLPTINPATGNPCTMLGRIPAPSSTLTKWGVQWLFRLDQPNTTTRTFMRILSTGTVAEWYIQASATGFKILAKNSDETTILDSPFTWGALTGGPYGRWMKAEFSAVQQGSLINWHIGWVTVGASAVAINGTLTGTVGRPTAVASPPDGYSADLSGMALGHITAWSVDDNFGYENAITGWAGEPAGTRMLRLAGEEGVPLRLVGAPADTAPVGPQGAAELLDLLRECAEADGGLLCESPDRRELLYRTRTSLYNQQPALILDYSRGQLAEPFEPVEDDSVRNLWEVERAGGSSGTAELTTGALSTQAPPAGIGLVADSTTLNLATDEQTEPMANWLLHLSTWDEARYPSVTLLLHKCPELIPAVLDLREGDLVRIINLPRQFTGSGRVDLLVDSLAETLLPRAWSLTLNCAAAGPWTLAESVLVEDFSRSTYSVTITSGGNAPWVRSQVHYQSDTWSLKSGAIGNNQVSDAVVTVPTGATSLTFWYYVSSEESGPGFEGDRFVVLVDGVQILRAQGLTGWRQATIPVTGALTVTFRYVKDNSGAAGEDAAWIDDLMFVRGTAARADTDGSTLAAAAGPTDATLSVKVSVGMPWITTAANESEFPFDVVVGGERMTVTKIVGASSPQTFTVVRSVNSVRKAQAAGTPVNLAEPAVVAL